MLQIIINKYVFIITFEIFRLDSYGLMNTNQKLFEEFKDNGLTQANFIDKLEEDEGVLRLLEGAHTNHLKKHVRFQN